MFFVKSLYSKIMEQEEPIEFYEENGFIKKRSKVRESSGSVHTYRDIQENKRRIRLQEEAKARKAFDPDEDARDMGIF